MKVVLDTNVILSGLIFPGGPPDKIMRAVLSRHFHNTTSPDLLTELRRVLKKKFHLADEKIASMVQLLSETSELVYPTERLYAIKADETDNRVLECAVTGKAQAIITADFQHLLKLKSFRSIAILTPTDFIEKFGLV